MVRGTVNVLQTPPFYVVFLHLFFLFFCRFPIRNDRHPTLTPVYYYFGVNTFAVAVYCVCRCFLHSSAFFSLTFGFSVCGRIASIM